MSDSFRDPPRWRDRTDQQDAAELAAGHALRRARAMPLRTAPPLHRVARRIATQPQRRLAWVLAAAGLILGIGTAASAEHLDLLPRWLNRIVSPSPSASTGERARPHRARPRSPAPVVPAAAAPAVSSAENTESIPAQSTAAAAPAAPSERHDVRKPAAPVATLTQPSRVVVPSGRRVAMLEDSSAKPSAIPVPSGGGASSVNLRAPDPQPDPQATEPTAQAEPSLAPPLAVPVAPASQQAPVPALPGTVSNPARLGVAQVQSRQDPARSAGYLTESVRLLRSEHAPAAALRLLDEHQGELAENGFRHEAQILRVEALVSLDRRAEALRLLDGMSLTDGAASAALLITRGQLRAAANRCGEGISDFDLALARSKDVDRHALVGRALCRKKLGDTLGANADVRRLRAEFPSEKLPAELQGER